MILFDTETTNVPLASAAKLSLQPFIIQMTFIALNNKTLKKEDEFSTFVNSPGRPPITKEVTDINGITEEMLKDAPPFSAHFPRVMGMWHGQWYSIAHNNDFDTSMLNFELLRIGKELSFPWAPYRRCTAEATRHIHGYRMKMGDLYELATGKKLAGAHRSDVDTNALAECVRWCIKNQHITLE